MDPKTTKWKDGETKDLWQRGEVDRVEGGLRRRAESEGNNTLCTYMYENYQRINYKMFNLCYIPTLSYTKLSSKKGKKQNESDTLIASYEANSLSAWIWTLRTLLPSAGQHGMKLVHEKQVSEADFKLNLRDWNMKIQLALCILYRAFNWCSKESRKKFSLQNPREKWPTSTSWGEDNWGTSWGEGTSTSTSTRWRYKY